MLKTKKLIFFCIIILSALHLQAQKSKYPRAMELRDFEKFVGIWDSEANITIDSVLHKVQYHMNFRRTADNYGFNMDEAFTDSALGDLRGANLIGYGEDKKFHWYSVNNMGTTYERVGQWDDSDNLTFTYTTKKGEKKYDEVTNYTFKGNDMFSYKQTSNVDGKVVKKITGRFTRRQMTPPKPNK